MAMYHVEKSFPSEVRYSENVSAVARLFGLGQDANKPVQVLGPSDLRIEPGDVVYVTGGSGSGKSVLLRELQPQFEDAISLSSVGSMPDEPLVDCFGGDLEDALCWLSTAGLSDAFAILRRPSELSDGQRYRFQLARALACEPSAIFADEFCNTLDRITASVVAHHVRRFADRFGMTFVLATSHDDLLEDLAPDVVVVKHTGSDCDVYYPGRGLDEED